MVAAIQKAYPTMPAALVQLDADIRRQLDENAPRALIDWLTTPGAAAPANVVSTAQADVGLCILPADGITVEDAKAKLGDQALRFDVADGMITVLAHSTGPSVQLCCSLQNQLTRIGASDYWVSRRRLADSDEAIVNLTILPPPGQRISRGETYRGPKARPAPVEVKKLAGRIVDRELNSVALGEPVG